MFSVILLLLRRMICDNDRFTRLVIAFLLASCATPVSIKHCFYCKLLHPHLAAVSLAAFLLHSAIKSYSFSECLLQRNFTLTLMIFFIEIFILFMTTWIVCADCDFSE